MATVVILVKYYAGGYHTCTVRGSRASSTMNAETAAERLGVKLYGPSFSHIREITGQSRPVGESKWEIFSREGD